MSIESAKLDLSPITEQLYRELPPELYEVTAPARSPEPALIELNLALLNSMGIDAGWFLSEQGLAAMSGNDNYPEAPIALAYGGHQFGHWSPLLGDGRAHMLGQVIRKDGVAIDVQLKGSGPTRFSRGGDGRATLGAVLREYIVSEAMAGLHIPTTRAIAVIGTGEDIIREQLSPGAILVRTAKSHLRVGSFQYTAANLGEAGVRALADFVITHNFPQLAALPNRYLQLLNRVIQRQASLIAEWMLVGFIHGVMNTDNMSIVGETIDYGPCAFLDEFQPQKVFSSIDQYGRYAWDQQADIGHWNLTQFAGALLPLLDTDQEKAIALAKASLADFSSAFQTAFHLGMTKKLGISEEGQTGTTSTFITATLTALAENSIDYTVFFDHLTLHAMGESESIMTALFTNKQKGDAWLEQWQGLRSTSPDKTQAMRNANPRLIARNHRVEEAIQAAVQQNDLEPFQRLCRALANPFTIDPEAEALQSPPRPEERVTQTFCGT